MPFQRAPSSRAPSCGTRAQQVGADRDAARERVALLMLAAFERGVEQRRLEAAKRVAGQEVGHDDEAVAVELLAQVRGQQPGEPRAAPAREARGRAACAERGARRG